MSSIVLQNDSMVFGTQSPYHKYITDPGVKEKFFRYIGDRNSKVLIKRGFNTFLLMNKIFPNSTVEINENVKYALGQLINPFVVFGVMNDNKSIVDMSRNKYSLGEIALTNELQKATKVKNLTALITEDAKEHMAAQHGITVYITKTIKSSGEEELETEWYNKFFAFNNPDSIGITVIIPKSYIASVALNAYAGFKSKGTLGSSIENVAYKSYLVDQLTKDLVKGFFAAIFADGYRTRVNGDIYNLAELFTSEGAAITSREYSKNIHDTIAESNVFKKHPALIKKFKSSSSENLVLFMLEQIKYSNFALINPIELYKGFIDVPYGQMESVFAKSNAFKRFDRGDNTFDTYNYSNNLADMDKFMIEDSRDIIVYATKLVRFLPVLIYNTYVIGNGSDHSKTVQVLNNVEKFMRTLDAYKTASPNTQNIIKFLYTELMFIKSTLFNELSSPINVTNDARLVITSAIEIYGAVKDDEQPAADNTTEE